MDQNNSSQKHSSASVLPYIFGAERLHTKQSSIYIYCILLSFGAIIGAALLNITQLSLPSRIFLSVASFAGIIAYYKLLTGFQTPSPSWLGALRNAFQAKKIEFLLWIIMAVVGALITVSALALFVWLLPLINIILAILAATLIIVPFIHNQGFKSITYMARLLLLMLVFFSDGLAAITLLEILSANNPKIAIEPLLMWSIFVYLFLFFLSHIDALESSTATSRMLKELLLYWLPAGLFPLVLLMLDAGGLFLLPVCLIRIGFSLLYIEKIA